MGKARILSAQGEGLYSIEILEDRTRAESRKVRAQQRIADIDTALTDLEQDLDAAQLAVDDGATAQDQAIADYQDEPTAEHRQAMEDQAAKLIKLAEARDAVRTQIASLNLERLTLQTAIDRVDALPALRQQNAWCADYTEDLSGEVATAEVPGEIGHVIIRPGYDDGAAWDASEDGAIQPALAGTPASVFYNLAMMPGWQKWRPTFRLATISNINNDLCDITLVPATSSQQGLNVNASSAYDDVPIYYMDCNGVAFEEGDRVLVAFSGQTGSPMVVGFESEPRLCGEVSFTFSMVRPDTSARLNGYLDKHSTPEPCDGGWSVSWEIAEEDFSILVGPGFAGSVVLIYDVPHTESTQIESGGLDVSVTSSFICTPVTMSGGNGWFVEAEEQKSVAIEFTYTNGDSHVILLEGTALKGNYIEYVSIQKQTNGECSYQIDSSITEYASTFRIECNGHLAADSSSNNYDILPSTTKAQVITSPYLVDGSTRFMGRPGVHTVSDYMDISVDIKTLSGGPHVTIGIPTMQASLALGDNTVAPSVTFEYEIPVMRYITLVINEDGAPGVIPDELGRPSLV